MRDQQVAAAVRVEVGDVDREIARAADVVGFGHAPDGQPFVGHAKPGRGQRPHHDLVPPGVRRAALDDLDLGVHEQGDGPHAAKDSLERSLAVRRLPDRQGHVDLRRHECHARLCSKPRDGSGGDLNYLKGNAHFVHNKFPICNCKFMCLVSTGSKPKLLSLIDVGAAFGSSELVEGQPRLLFVQHFRSRPKAAPTSKISYT